MNLDGAPNAGSVPGYTPPPLTPGYTPPPLLSPARVGVPVKTPPTVAAHNASSVFNGKAVATTTQGMLKRLGYNVAQDGIMGPQTQSALAAMKAGMKAAVWNAHLAHAVDPNATDGAHPPLPQGASGTIPAPDSRTPQGTTKPGQTSLVNSILSAMGKALPGDQSGRLRALESLLVNNQVDPNKLAGADANAQYDPAISGLKSNISAQTAQGTQDQTDIKNWYDALVNNIGVRNDQNTAGDASAVNAIGSATGGVASALGLDPGTAGGNNIYQTGDIQANAARANQASEQSFGRDLQGATASQGLTALTNQHNVDANKLADLNTQEQAQETAKGNSLVSSRAAYRQQNASNQTAYANQKLAVEGAANAAGEQHFKDVAALQSNKLAAVLGTQKAATDAAKVVVSANTAAGKLDVARTTAKAAMIRATADSVKARAAGVSALAKLQQNSGSLFPGIKAKDATTALFNVGNTIQSTPSLYDPKKGVLPGKTQAIVQLVGAKMRQLGADPRTSPEARYQAFNILEVLGITPGKGWYK